MPLQGASIDDDNVLDERTPCETPGLSLSVELFGSDSGQNTGRHGKHKLLEH